MTCPPIDKKLRISSRAAVWAEVRRYPHLRREALEKMDHYSILDPVPPEARTDVVPGNDLAPASSIASIHVPSPDLTEAPLSSDRFEKNANPPDLDSALRVIAERAQFVTGASGAAIALKQGSDLVCRAATGSTAPDLGARLEVRSGLTAECLRTGEVLRCDNAELDPRVDLESCRRLGIEGIIVLPIYNGSQLAGIFELFAPHAYSFQERDVETLKGMAKMVSFALEGASPVAAPAQQSLPPRELAPNGAVQESRQQSNAGDPAPKPQFRVLQQNNAVCSACAALLDNDAAICPQCGVFNEDLQAKPEKLGFFRPGRNRLIIPACFLLVAMLVAFAPLRRTSSPPTNSSGDDQSTTTESPIQVPIDTSRPEQPAEPASPPAENAAQPPANEKTADPDGQAADGKAGAQPSNGKQKVSAGVKQLLAGVSSDFSKLLPLNRDAQSTESAKNPKTKVWVDTRKGYYYCPGDRQYGKTDKGTYMTQENAESNYYTPALMKPCR